MRRIAQVLVVLEALVGCDDEPTAVERNISALRAATRDFKDIAVARSAGYDTQFPPAASRAPMGRWGSIASSVEEHPNSRTCEHPNSRTGLTVAA